MSIDEHIAQLKKLKSFHNGSYGASINYAIDIIRKYQRIQKIINDWKDGRFSDEVGCLRVKRALEEESDDKDN